MFVLAASLWAYDESLYYLFVQEDEYLEWATFWGFISAAGIYFSRAIREVRIRRPLAWFVFGLSLFCFFVAMEEISWGQRLLGYKAPDYFLEQNYQQELNIHNVVDTGARKFILQSILLGYGVILSAASMLPSVSRLLQHLRIVAAPPVLIVSFLAMFVIYSWYPLSHTGEWVELTMAYGFVFAAMFYRSPENLVSNWSSIKNVAVVFAATWVLAALTVSSARMLRAEDPAKVDQAKREVEALAADFASGHLHTRCGIHKRLYTFLREYQQPYLLDGEFARLLASRSEDARAAYLLDPWNSAYWIRHKCEDGREARFVYSFGPNRRRDSTEWVVRDEDIGSYLESN